MTPETQRKPTIAAGPSYGRRGDPPPPGRRRRRAGLPPPSPGRQGALLRPAGLGGKAVGGHRGQDAGLLGRWRGGGRALLPLPVLPEETGQLGGEAQVVAVRGPIIRRTGARQPLEVLWRRRDAMQQGLRVGRLGRLLAARTSFGGSDKSPAVPEAPHAADPPGLHPGPKRGRHQPLPAVLLESATASSQQPLAAALQGVVSPPLQGLANLRREGMGGGECVHAHFTVWRPGHRGSDHTGEGGWKFACSSETEERKG
mmetsp:Transcript_24100/g.66994  ORF Transcript_24100/g.66994 Transcript_24100/m.66994 type:complete len:257 (+) Transcript_24100:1722-2492(+)